MKTALAFVCSLLLLWTQFVQAGVAGASVARPARDCGCCCGSSCCSADTPRPESQPVSATPALSSVHGQTLAPAPAIIAWVLPQAEAGIPASTAPQTIRTAGELYARNCVLLI